MEQLLSRDNRGLQAADVHGVKGDNAVHGKVIQWSPVYFLQM